MAKGKPPANDQLKNPIRFRETLKDFELFLLTNKQLGERSLSRFVGTDWKKIPNNEDNHLNFSVFVKLLKHVKVTKLVPLLKEVLSDENILELYDDFPKKPKTLSGYHYYCKQQYVGGANHLKEEKSFSRGLIKGIAKSWSSLSENEKIEYNRLAQLHQNSAASTAIADLEKFFDSHPEVDFLRESKLLEYNIKSRKKEKSNAKRIHTAFDIYLEEKKNKYTDLAPEKRLSKLRRHFDKKTPEEIREYEIAAQAKSGETHAQTATQSVSHDEPSTSTDIVNGISKEEMLGDPFSLNDEPLASIKRKNPDIKAEDDSQTHLQQRVAAGEDQPKKKKKKKRDNETVTS